jgi:urease accessory protein
MVLAARMDIQMDMRINMVSSKEFSKNRVNLTPNALSPIPQAQILAALFSPAFPIGAFSYSHGMEAAIATGAIGDVGTVHDWIETCLVGGSGRNDAILMAHAYDIAGGDDPDIGALNELAFALSSGAERAQESRELGENFIRIVEQVYNVDVGIMVPLAYPVAAGLAVRRLGCELPLGVTFFLQSFVSNLISVAVRTVPIGQSDGQIILARLMPVVVDLAEAAAITPLDDVGGYAFLADHAAILHETLETRIYRT